MPYKPISDYGIIGNMLSAALVGRDGSIDWCCLPRFDAASIFAALLDDERGGRFQIRTVLPSVSHQSYIHDTNVLQMTLETGSGRVTVTDFMPCYLDARGRPVRLNEIHRLVDCSEGEVALEAVFEPRMDYARSHTRLSIKIHGIVAELGSEILALSATVPFTVHEHEALARFNMRQGQSAGFVIRYGSNRPRPFNSYDSVNKMNSTTRYWQQLSRECLFPSKWRDTIARSYLALHLLVYSPTGAVIAAPTTSLPEEIGGVRNWDYRYTWLRDASLTIDTLSYLGHNEEARGFMKWLLSVCDKCGPKAQILYNIDFKNPLQEHTLTHLKGYRGSRPVRIGNAAYGQRQLDVFGEVLQAANNHLDNGGHLSRRAWGLLATFVDAAALLWQLPDNGIWEVRGGPYHFVHSKVMCWVAVDRGIKIALRLGHTKNIKRWQRTAENIRHDILNRGWNSGRGAFTQHYDTQTMDASNLLIPLFGFLPVSDERMMATIEQTVKELDYHGLLRRYLTDRTDDGLSGSEGAFLWCSFWLVRILLRLGRLDEAVSLYEKLLGYGNHLSLFSEMVDPVTGEALGNFPQALTHLAIIHTGIELNQAVAD